MSAHFWVTHKIEMNNLKERKYVTYFIIVRQAAFYLLSRPICQHILTDIWCVLLRKQIWTLPSFNCYYLCNFCSHQSHLVYKTKNHAIYHFVITQATWVRASLKISINNLEISLYDENTRITSVILWRHLSEIKMRFISISQHFCFC